MVTVFKELVYLDAQSSKLNGNNGFRKLLFAPCNSLTLKTNI